MICGSRNPKDPFAASIAVSEMVNRLEPGMVVLNGGAKGIDEMVLQTVRFQSNVQEIDLGIDWTRPITRLHKLSILCLVFRPNYKRDGKAAPIIRNLHMLDRGPEMVIALHNGISPGTRHVIEEARRRGIETVVVEV